MDSQGDVSVIKAESIKNPSNINSNDTIKLRGITSECVNSLGSIKLEMIFDDGVTIEHKFQVVDNDFPIPSSCLIGKDFIFKYSCILDYQNMTFSINIEDNEIPIPIRLGPNSDTIAIPARAEVFRCFHIQNFSGPCLIEKCEIAPGVFRADTVAYDNKPLVRILNTTLNPVILDNSIDETTDINNFDAYTMNTTAKEEKRDIDIYNTLKNKVPKQYAERLLDLCMEFSDVFAHDDCSGLSGYI